MTNIAGRFLPRRVVWAAACLWAAALGTAQAQSQHPAPCRNPVLTLAEAAELLRVDASELDRIATRGEMPGRRIGTDWRFECAAIMAWLSGGPEGNLEAALPATRLADITASGTTSTQNVPASPPSSPAAADSQQTPIGEAPQERTAEDVFLRGQRVLLGPGDVVVDVGQFFSRRDDLLLTTAPGVVGLATLEQRALMTLLVGRVGIFNETELFAGVSYSRQYSRQFVDGTTLMSSERGAFGATTVGVRRTLLRERVGRPDVIVTLSGQVPTEAAPAAAAVGVVLIKSLDPVVLFANTNYFHAFRKDSGDVASRLRSADIVDLSAGYGLGLNDTVAISMAVSGAFARATTLEGVSARQPAFFGARFGLTAWLARGLYIEPSVSFGLTGPGDTVAFGVTVPYAF